jgi:hypothetical protein
MAQSKTAAFIVAIFALSVAPCYILMAADPSEFSARSCDFIVVFPTAPVVRRADNGTVAETPKGFSPSIAARCFPTAGPSGTVARDITEVLLAAAERDGVRVLSIIPVESDVGKWIAINGERDIGGARHIVTYRGIVGLKSTLVVVTRERANEWPTSEVSQMLKSIRRRFEPHT